MNFALGALERIKSLRVSCMLCYHQRLPTEWPACWLLPVGEQILWTAAAWWILWREPRFETHRYEYCGLGEISLHRERDKERERCWRLIVSISGYPTTPVISQVRKFFIHCAAVKRCIWAMGWHGACVCDNRKLWIHHVTPCCVRRVCAIAFTWLSCFLWTDVYYA